MSKRFEKHMKWAVALACWIGLLLGPAAAADATPSVSAVDLQKAFEAASGRDLSVIFKTWVYGDQ